MAVQVQNEYGSIAVDENVISMLAGMAAVECYGIVGMASKRASDGFIELLGRDNLTRGVRIETKNDELIINLYAIVEYGVSLAAVSQSAIENVKYNVERLSGLKVSRVNLTIEGVRV